MLLRMISVLDNDVESEFDTMVSKDDDKLKLEREWKHKVIPYPA